MRKSSLKIIFITLIFLFIFTISSYASTDYSIYDESSGKYHIEFSDSMKTSLGLPSADIPCSFDTDNLYYFLVKEADGTYYFFYNTLNFIEVSSDNSDFNGTYKLKLPNDSRFKHFYMSAGSTEWVDGDFYRYGYYTTSDLSSILVSSDDIHNNVTNNVIVSKTVYTEDSGDSGDTGDSGDSGENEDINNPLPTPDSKWFVPSSSYNTEWIESYLDLNQNPVDGIKTMIDDHPEFFNYSSSELPKYWLLEKVIDDDDYEGNYYYSFVFSSEPILERQHYGSHCDYYSLTLANSTSVSACLKFVSNGFYCDGKLTTREFGDNPTGSHIVSDSIEIFDTESISYVYNSDYHHILKSNHDVYHIDNAFKGTVGSLVFQPPTLKTATTLAPVIQRERTKGILQVVLTEIIQILPLIIVVVVSLVGLRKALRMLSTLLSRS